LTFFIAVEMAIPSSVPLHNRALAMDAAFAACAAVAPCQ